MITEVKKGVAFDIDTSDNSFLRIQFCHKDEKGTFRDGVTTEDILRMLIMRQSHFAHKDTSEENLQALVHMKQALISLENRVSKKIKRYSQHAT